MSHHLVEEEVEYLRDGAVPLEGHGHVEERVALRQVDDRARVERVEPPAAADHEVGVVVVAGHLLQGLVHAPGAHGHVRVRLDVLGPQSGERGRAFISSLL